MGEHRNGQGPTRRDRWAVLAAELARLGAPRLVDPRTGPNRSTRRKRKRARRVKRRRILIAAPAGPVTSAPRSRRRRLNSRCKRRAREWARLEEIRKTGLELTEVPRDRMGPEPFYGVEEREW